MLQKISFKQMIKSLSPYLRTNGLLEIGLGDGYYTKIFSDYSKHIEAVDISSEMIGTTQKKLKTYKNVILKPMAADKLEYSDESFDAVVTTSFHEFSPKIQQKSFEEMYRVCKFPKTLIFIEPDVDSVTNELFKVFDPKENHSQRIKKSFAKIFKFVKEKSMRVGLQNKTERIDKFSSENDLIDSMLAWWADIKVPKNQKEKTEMSSQIEKILEDAGMLQKLVVIENIQFYVFRSK